MSTKEILTPEQQRRQAVFVEMSVDLQKIALDFDKRRSAEAHGLIKLRYGMGARLKAVLADDARYGSNAVEQLAEYLNESPTALYAMRNVAVEFTEEEILALAERKTANNHNISWAHVLGLGAIQKAGDRKKLTERIFAENLSAAELATEVSAGVETRNKRSGGRKPSKPTSAIAGVQQIVSTTQSVNNRFTVWQESVFDAIDEMEPPKIDDILVEKLKQAQDQFEALETNLEQYNSRLKKNLDRVQKVLAIKASDAAKAVKKNKAEEKQMEGGARKPRKAVLV